MRASKNMVPHYIDKYERKGIMNSDTRQKHNIIVDEGKEPMIFKKADINMVNNSKDINATYISSQNNNN